MESRCQWVNIGTLEPLANISRLLREQVGTSERRRHRPRARALRDPRWRVISRGERWWQNGCWRAARPATRLTSEQVRKQIMRRTQRDAL